MTPATANIRVSIDNLIDMTTVNDFPFRLYGVTTSHPINWFAAPQTVTALRSATNKYISAQLNDPQIVDAISVLSQLGYDFRNEEPNGPYRGGIVVPKSPEILFINDISLPLGGLFDVDSDFASPHGGHRDGGQSDLDSKHLVGGNEPYKIFGSSWDYPPFTSAIGDPRLEQLGGSSPFTNADTFVGANKKITNYSDSIRKRMNQQVKVIHYRRLQLLLDALAASGGTFARESNHIHVKF